MYRQANVPIRATGWSDMGPILHYLNHQRTTEKVKGALCFIYSWSLLQLKLLARVEAAVCEAKIIKKNEKVG